jgi:hypothetical protein
MPLTYRAYPGEEPKIDCTWCGRFSGLRIVAGSIVLHLILALTVTGAGNARRPHAIDLFWKPGQQIPRTLT